MPTRSAPLGSRRLVLLFVLVLLAPAVVVVWLGVRLVEQDETTASRQLQERREAVTDRLVGDLAQAVSVVEAQLRSDTEHIAIGTDDDAVEVWIGPDGVEGRPAGRLLYVPWIPPDSAVPAAAFAAAEALEFKAWNYPAAAAALSKLATTDDVLVRSGALLRLGRVLRRDGRHEEALRAYADLAGLPGVRLSGVPAELVARRARCLVLETAGRHPELAIEARALQADLLAGRWAIDRGTFQAYVEQVDQWAGNPSEIEAERVALSEATTWLWQRWTNDRDNAAGGGRQALMIDDRPITILWQPRTSGIAAIVAGPQFQQRVWFDALAERADADGLRVALTDAGRHPTFGSVPADVSATESRPSALTGLPWSVTVSHVDATADLEEIAARRQLWLVALALLVGLVATGGYVVARALSRELAVARLQSDFVSAVSHEFRTPLTSLQQFVDLLADAPEPDAVDRQTFYAAQGRAVARLRRLVESLLDFGRMEAGARPYRFERHPLAPLVRGIVDDFRRDAAPEDFTIDVSTTADAEHAVADVDADALTRALWNLLDNAVKYSGTSRKVSIEVAMEDRGLAIRVVDQGLGIPRRELRSIFDTFVRGVTSRHHGVKGTGIGLSIVRHVVAAHRGTVHVESIEGQGSTFTVVLPVATEASPAAAAEAAPGPTEEGAATEWHAS